MADPCQVHGDQAVSDRLSNVYANRMRALSDDLLHGTLSLEGWHTSMMDAIRLAYLHQAVAGAPDSDERLISSADMRRMEQDIAEQYRFLDKFAADIESAVIKEGASLDFIPARSALYAGSSSAEYWRQALDVQLPNFPRDWSTPCGSNCQCSWRLECERDSRGVVVAVLAFWDLDPNVDDESHCDVCPTRAREWNPLRIPINQAKAA